MSQIDDSTSVPEKTEGASPEPTATEVDAGTGDKPLMAGPALALIVTGLALAAFLIALDTSIVATVSVSI